MKKEWRIKKSEEFQTVIHQGKKSVNPCFVLYSSPKKEAQCRFGISLSKKIGGAVQRNKIKRQVRSMLLDVVDFTQYPNDGVLIIRMPYKEKDYLTNKNYLEKLLNKDTIK